MCAEDAHHDARAPTLYKIFSTKVVDGRVTLARSPSPAAEETGSGDQGQDEEVSAAQGSAAQIGAAPRMATKIATRREVAESGSESEDGELD